MKSRAAMIAMGIASLVLAGTAFGGTEPPLTTVSVDVKPVSETKAQYKGVVVSDLRACEKRRVIKLFAAGNRLVRAVSNKKGKFKEIGKIPPKGEKLTLKVKAKSKDCPALSLTQ